MATKHQSLALQWHRQKIKGDKYDDKLGLCWEIVLEVVLNILVKSEQDTDTWISMFGVLVFEIALSLMIIAPLRKRRKHGSIERKDLTTPKNPHLNKVKSKVLRRLENKEK